MNFSRAAPKEQKAAVRTAAMLFVRLFSYIGQLFDRSVRTLDNGIFELPRKGRAETETEFVAQLYLLRFFFFRQPFCLFFMSKLVYSYCKFVFHKIISLLPFRQDTLLYHNRSDYSIHFDAIYPAKMYEQNISSATFSAV